jgi:prepilin-type N-terminal cleavage/methylation domain-containing protein/prepilin-type processing-associated H-X9-DG protein
VSRRGYTLIELLVVIAIIAVLVGLLLAAVQKVRATAARTDCQNRLRQLALAAHQFHDAREQLPAGVTFQTGSDKLPLSGWQVHLLPFVEQTALHQQALDDYKQNPAVQGPPPHRGLSAVVPAYICPADDRVRAPQFSARDNLTVAFTSFLGVCGQDCLARDGVLYPSSATRLADVADGLSNTLLLGERPPGHDFHFGWWYAGLGQLTLTGPTGSGDMLLGVREANVQPILAGDPCGPGVYLYKPAGGFGDPCGVFHFWSPHPGGANFALADGSVRLIPYTAAAILPALASRAGGESVPPPD